MARTSYTSLAAAPEPHIPTFHYRYASIALLLVLVNTIIYYQVYQLASIDQDYIFIDLQKIYNNRGYGEQGSNLDGLGNHFSRPDFVSSPRIGTIPFAVVDSKNNDNDATAAGQVITLPKRRLGALYLLATATHGPVTSSHLAITYQDGSISSTIIDIPDWQVSQAKDIERLDLMSCETNHRGINGSVFLVPLYVDPAKPVSHLTLPYTSSVGSFGPTLHTFAITALPATPGGAKILSMWASSEFETSGAAEFELKWFRARVQNTSPRFLSHLKITIEGARVVKQGVLDRLGPGQIAIIRLAVQVSSLAQPRQVTVSSKSWLGVQTTVAQDTFELDLTNMTEYTHNEK